MTAKQQEEVVMIDSDRSASLVTVTGWRSRDGRFYGDNEYAARWAGCTHIKCWTCGEPAVKGYMECQQCRDSSAKAKYAAMPTAEWDGVAMLYSDGRDEYFYSPEEAEDSLEDCQTLADLRLRICEPEYAREIAASDWEDQLPDDGDCDAPCWLQEAVDRFNASITGHAPLSWWPGKVALRIEK